MGKRKQVKKGAAYKGFRLGIAPKLRFNIQLLEKLNVLTNLQHDIAKTEWERGFKLFTEEEEECEGIEISMDLFEYSYRNRIECILAKPVNEAEVDHLGNDWEKPKEYTKEEIDKMNKDAVEKGKKGKSRKDLENKDENETS